MECWGVVGKDDVHVTMVCNKELRDKGTLAAANWLKASRLPGLPLPFQCRAQDEMHAGLQSSSRGTFNNAVSLIRLLHSKKSEQAQLSLLQAARKALEGRCSDACDALLAWLVHGGCTGLPLHFPQNCLLSRASPITETMQSIKSMAASRVAGFARTAGKAVGAQAEAP